MKSKNLKLKLSSYSALAGIFIIADQSANAQVVYTDVDPDYYFTEPVGEVIFSYLQIDFDHDSNGEIYFGFSSVRSADDCYVNGSMSFYLVNYASVLVYNDTASIPRVKKLNEGDDISEAAGTWNNNFLHTLMYSDFYTYTCDSIPQFPDLRGNWINEIDKYIGVKFNAGGDTYYGWVRLSVVVFADEGDAEIDHIQIDGYAYESTPGMAITVGEGYVPQSIANINRVEFKCFPNPVSEQLSIKLPEFVKENYSCIISDISGKNVVQEIKNYSDNRVDVSHLPNGIYSIEIIADGKSGYSKFVKQ